MTARKPRLLLTGATGFLGFSVYHQAKEQYQILGIGNTHSLALPGMQMLKLDITQETGLRNTIRETRPDAIIHLAANSDVNYCQQYRTETDKINVQAAINIAKFAAELEIPLVFTSSDMVFDGEKGNYTEDDAANPINYYGEQKLKAEEWISKVHPAAAICRMPLMLGPAGPTSKSFLQAHLEKLSNGEALHLFVDEYRSPLFSISAAQGLLHALNHFQGLFHLGGSERLSRYELGLLIANLAQVSNPNIVASNQADVAMPAPRPQDASMNSGKAMIHGFHPLDVAAELALMLAK